MSVDSNKRDVPADFNWVKARLDCSPRHLFSLLVSRLKKDADLWATETKSAPLTIHNQSHEDLYVERQIGPVAAIDSRSTLSIELKDQRIYATLHLAPFKEPKTPFFVPNLNSEGECRLCHDGKELRVWEVSKLLLEEILFPVSR